MFENIRIRQAQIIGRLHLLDGMSMQDSYKVGMVTTGNDQAIYGIICDGCSRDADNKPLHSEVGSRLGADFLEGEIERLLKARVPLKRIPPILHERLVYYLRKQVDIMSYRDPRDQIRFIVDKLLFTVMSFIYTETETMIFYQGDGVYIVNDEITVIDQKDRPAYIGYHAINRKWLPSSVSEVQRGFETLVYPTKTIKKMAIASDSLDKEKDPDFYPELWDHKGINSLQRRVNVWSLNEHKFKDDLSIITLEKVEA
jgi:hypothetical protein